MKMSDILSNSPHNEVWRGVYNSVDGWSIHQVKVALFVRLNRFYNAGHSLRIAVNRSEDA